MKKLLTLALTLIMICSALIVPMQISAATAEYATFSAPGTVRIDETTGYFDGYVGMQITVGASDIKVTALGRLFISGNSQSHDVIIADATSFEEIAKVKVPAGGENNKFTYADLASAVTLKAGKTYFIASHESKGGDGWYHNDSVLKFSSVATCDKSCYKDDAETQWGAEGAPNTAYGPVSFKYETADAPTQSTPVSSDNTADAPSSDVGNTDTSSDTISSQPTESQGTSSTPDTTDKTDTADNAGSLTWLWIVIAVIVVAAVVVAVVIIKRKNK